VLSEVKVLDEGEIEDDSVISSTPVKSTAVVKIDDGPVGMDTDDVVQVNNGMMCCVFKLLQIGRVLT